MYVNIKPSTSQGKKMMAIFYDEAKKKVKTTHFGAIGYESYPDHQDLQRKMNYIQRHEARENWKDPMTAGTLSKFLLWNKPSLSASYKDFRSKFNYHLY